MADIQWVMYVYFDRDIGRTELTEFDTPDLDDSHFLGLQLWKHEGKSVYRWAIDYISGHDERFVIFGPFDIKRLAYTAFTQLNIDPNLILGYKMEMAHIVKNIGTGGYYKFPHDMWTDG